MTLLIPKQEIIRRPAHLSLVRKLPCCLSLHRFNIEAHHLLRVPGHEHCLGRKSGDNWAVPVRADLHRLLHNGFFDEPAFCYRQGLPHEDVLDTARRLWALTEEGLKGEAWLEAGRKVVEG
jgi:hypothetical protein